MRRVLNYVCDWTAGLLICGLRIIFSAIAVVSALLLCFLVSAQFTRYLRAAEWPSVQNLDLLEIFRVPLPPAPTNDFVNTAVSRMLELPATPTAAVLLIASILMLVVAARIEQRRQSGDPRIARRQAILADIEKAIARPPE